MYASAHNFYRFSPTTGWITHLWKSATRQDHAIWRTVLHGLIPADGVAIDVGAHGGQFTRLLAGLVPDGLVIAVEPSSYARSVLRPALWLRGIRNAIIVAVALGAESGSAMLHTPIKKYGDMGYGLANIGSDGTGNGVSEAVAMTTLDALVTAMGLPCVHFVKADIEGHEAAMLAGGRETIRRFRPVLLLEQDATFLSRAGFGLAGLWADLVAAGYRPHRLSPDGRMPVLIEGAPQQGDVLWIPQPS